MNLFLLRQVDLADATEVLGVLTLEVRDDLVNELLSLIMTDCTLHGWQILEVEEYIRVCSQVVLLVSGRFASLLRWALLGWENLEGLLQREAKLVESH